MRREELKQYEIKFPNDFKLYGGVTVSAMKLTKKGYWLIAAYCVNRAKPEFTGTWLLKWRNGESAVPLYPYPIIDGRGIFVESDNGVIHFIANENDRLFIFTNVDKDE